MSSALIWELTKNNNAFIYKRERTSRVGAVAFSAEPGNLLNVNSYKYSGIANDKTVDISVDLTLSKKTTAVNKPAKLNSQEQLTLHKVKSSKKVVDAVSAYRPDLVSAAKIRYTKVAKALAVRKGYSKKVAKSTKREKL